MAPDQVKSSQKEIAVRVQLGVSRSGSNEGTPQVSAQQLVASIPRPATSRSLRSHATHDAWQRSNVRTCLNPPHPLLLGRALTTLNNAMSDIIRVFEPARSTVTWLSLFPFSSTDPSGTRRRNPGGLPKRRFPSSDEALAMNINQEPRLGSGTRHMSCFPWLRAFHLRPPWGARLWQARLGERGHLARHPNCGDGIFPQIQWTKSVRTTSETMVATIECSHVQGNRIVPATLWCRMSSTLSQKEKLLLVAFAV